MHDFTTRWNQALDGTKAAHPHTDIRAFEHRIAGLLGVPLANVENAFGDRGQRATVESLRGGMEFVCSLSLDFHFNERGEPTQASFELAKKQIEPALLGYRAQREDSAFAIYEQTLRLVLLVLIGALAARLWAKRGGGRQPHVAEAVAEKALARLEKKKDESGEWLADWDPAHSSVRSLTNWVAATVDNIARDIASEKGIESIDAREDDDEEAPLVLQSNDLHPGAEQPSILRKAEVVSLLRQIGEEMPGQQRVVSRGGERVTIKFTESHRQTWRAYYALGPETYLLLDEAVAKVASHLDIALASVKRKVQECHAYLESHPRFAELTHQLVPNRRMQHRSDKEVEQMHRQMESWVAGAISTQKRAESDTYDLNRFRTLIHQSVTDYIEAESGRS